MIWFSGRISRASASAVADMAAKDDDGLEWYAEGLYNAKAMSPFVVVGRTLYKKSQVIRRRNCAPLRHGDRRQTRLQASMTTWANNNMTYQSQADAITVASLTNFAAVAPEGLRGYVQNSQSALQNQTQGALDSALSDEQKKNAADLQRNINSAATLQESANANAYISQLLQTQANAMQSQTHNVRNQQYKLRAELMQYQYLERYYRTATSVIIVTMIVTLVMLVPAALWRIGRMSILTFSVIVLVIVIAYLCLMVYISSVTAKRRHDSWHQINWPVNGIVSEAVRKGTSNP